MNDGAVVLAVAGVFFLSVLVFVYALTNPPPKKTRSQYTLPPLKPHTKDVFVKSMDRSKR